MPPNNRIRIRPTIWQRLLEKLPADSQPADFVNALLWMYVNDKVTFTTPAIKCHD